jgi:Helix-turn-helix domain
MDRAAASSPLEASAQADGLPLPRILTPYDAREALPISIAAKRACVSSRTMRNWCRDHSLGRRIGGRWRVSCVALQMYLDGDKRALAAYLGGA